MQLKKWTCLLIVILFSTQSNAQFFSYQATITLNNGEKVEGRIKLESKNHYNNKVTFFDKNADIIEYKPDDLQGFELENGDVYKSFEIYDKVTLKRKAFLVKRFLRCTVEGNINLYELDKRWFIQKKNSELVEIFQYKNPKYLRQDREAEVKAAKVLFSENEKTAKLYNRNYDKKMRKMNTRDIIKKHNKVFDEPIKLNYLHQKNEFNLGLFYENMSYLNPQLNSAQITHRVGLYSDFRLKGVYKSIEINTAFVHTYLDLDQSTYTNPQYHPDIQYNSFWIGGSYHFWESKKLHPYFGTGFSVDYYGRNYSRDYYPYWVMGIKYQFSNHFELKIENTNLIRLRLGVAYKF
jgi:hypothetical protein